MKQVDLVVVIPVGPSCRFDHIKDTIESVRFYTTYPYQIIIADDSQNNLGDELQAIFPDIQVLVTKKNLGKVAGLYINLSLAYKYALQHYDFKVLMKMDDDALVIRRNPHKGAMRLFDAYPETGMAGRYITGQLSADEYGNIHDNYWPRKQLIKDTCSWKIIRRPFTNWAFHKLFFKAVVNGYELGENIQGGVYFFSRQCLAHLSNAGLLPMQKLQTVNFGEDLLFSLLTKAIGMQLGNLGDNGLPVGCAWKGLPASPETLYKDAKRVIHSVRSWNNMDEYAIRRFFQLRRMVALSFSGIEMGMLNSDAK